MKKVCVTALALMLLLAMPASTLYAQSEGTWFKIPFPFVVADKQMPAGHYFVQSLYWNAVAIQQLGGKVGLITLAQSIKLPAGGEGKLIFHRYGGRYFLSEARLPRMDSGRKFYVTKEEVEMAGKQPTTNIVEVAAK